MSYTIDIYRKRMEPVAHWSDFALYVSFFPQLIAGPIVRAQPFFSQLKMTRSLSSDDINRGIALIVRGLVKKVVLADFLATYSDAAFTSPSTIGTPLVWLGVYAFAFQIYFDFSGYTDLARGTGRLLGFSLPENFRSPYAAISIGDFWRRWHITLSTWLRDYLYVPLGGNRSGLRKTCRNLLITMGLGGLWHGAAWTFVIWGLAHGVFLVAERIMQSEKRQEGRRFVLLRQIWVFHVICGLWIIFRAPDLHTASAVFQSLMQPVQSTNLPGHMLALGIIVLGMIFQWINAADRISQIFLELPSFVRGSAYAMAAIALAVFGSGAAVPFIYFQF